MFESLTGLSTSAYWPGITNGPGVLATVAGILGFLAGGFPILLWIRSRQAAAPLRQAFGLVAVLLAAGWIALALQPGVRSTVEGARVLGVAVVWVAGLATLRYLPRLLTPERFGLVEDLQRLRLLEAAVNASEDGILVVAPAAPDGSVLRIVYANSAFERMTGYSASEAIGLSPTILQSPESAVDWDALLTVRKALQTEVPTTVEVPSRRKDGTRVWAEWHIVPVSPRDDGPRHKVAVLRDTTERHRAQEEIRRARDFLNALLENVPVPVTVADSHDRFQLVNPAWERATGIPRDRALGRTAGELLSPDVAEVVRTQNASVRTSGRPVRGEREAETGSGRRVYLTVGFPLPEPDGRVGLTGEVAVDLTHQKRAEAAAQALNAELKRRVEEVETLIELSPVGIAVANDPDGRAVEVNRVLRDLLGLQPKPDLELTSIADRLRLRAQRGGREAPTDELPLYQCLSQGRPIDGVELRLALPDGSERVVMNSARPLFDDTGRVRGCVSVYTDITDRIRAETALRESEELFRGILAHIPCGVFWTDRDSVLLGYNDQFARDHGFASLGGAIRTDRDRQLLPDPSGNRTACDRQVIETGLPILNQEESWSRADGIRAAFLVSKVPLRDGAGAVSGVLGVYQDITELKRLEDQSRQTQKMEAVGRLAGGIAHDFNNLLTIINGSADLFLDAPGDPAASGLINDVLAAGERASALVRQLLTFSRRQSVRPETLDLNEVMGGLVALLRRLLGEAITVVTRQAAAPAWVRIDRGHLEQVVMNLAVNARDAMRGRGILTIATDVDLLAERAARQVRLAVSDTGEGMTEEVKGRIFEPFFTTKGPDKGTGLGLATVFGIVQQAGGTIEVESAPGAGSTFRVNLPWSQEPSRPIAPPAPRSVERRSRPVSVLLVEDQDAVRKFARMALEGQGHEVAEADSGEAALDLVGTGTRFDAIISDVVMPGIDGRELVVRVRATRPDIGVVLMSGYAPDSTQIESIERSVFLQKPFPPADLFAALDRTLLLTHGKHQVRHGHQEVGPPDENFHQPTRLADEALSCHKPSGDDFRVVE